MFDNLYGQLQVLEPEKKTLGEEERLKAISRPLLAWYRQYKRDLPWRENQDPYRVWISEIMLQQTRVEAVKPYFQRFLEAFPDIASLAAADEERLLKLWEGLGYYSRARNLQKCARVLMESYGGRMPADYEALKKLPGIGSYTAGAVASIAFGIPVPAVDGNVLRVLARVLKVQEDVKAPAQKKKIESLLEKTMDRQCPGDFNQALIEAGALICVPNGEPKCMVCPLFSLCLAGKEGLWQEIPLKVPKKERRREERTVFILERGTQVAVRKRPPKGLLASMYELPNVVGRIKPEEAAGALKLPPQMVESIEELPAAKHIFSHVEWEMTGFRIRISQEKQAEERPEQDWIYVEKESLQGKYPLPNAFQAYRKLIT